MEINKLPYSNEATNRIYELLFCDNAEIYRTENAFKNIYPWNILFFVKTATKELLKITEDEQAESRIRLLAFNKLLSEGYSVNKKELLGVVIEVHHESGPDTLAAYKDGTSRYINYSGRVIIWESPEQISGELINNLFRVSDEVIKQIGPWDKERLQYPSAGMVRISFLVSDGLYFGQGPINDFFNDPMSAPVLHAGTALMNFLINTSLEKK